MINFLFFMMKALFNMFHDYTLEFNEERSNAKDEIIWKLILSSEYP